jgi:hypothetical protein
MDTMQLLENRQHDREVEGQLRDIYEARHDLEPSVPADSAIRRGTTAPTASVGKQKLGSYPCSNNPRQCAQRVRERAIKGVRSIATYFRPRTGG